MKLELTVPPELLGQIVEELLERIKPLLMQFSRHEQGMEADVIFDVTGLSEYLAVSKKWLYEQTHQKAIPHYKLGNKQTRFRKKEIDTWLNSMRVPSASTPSIKPKNPVLLGRSRKRV